MNKDKEKWKEMVDASHDAQENFNDFSDDRAILYVADKILEIRETLNKLEKMLGDILV